MQAKLHLAFVTMVARFNSTMCKSLLALAHHCCGSPYELQPRLCKSPYMHGHSSCHTIQTYSTLLKSQSQHRQGLLQVWSQQWKSLPKPQPISSWTVQGFHLYNWASINAFCNCNTQASYATCRVLQCNTYYATITIDCSWAKWVRCRELHE